ncbi:hypothetical protein ACSBR1_001957 [Camellia fascicularis]
MSAFLRVANAIEDTDPEIQAWVKQVRDVAHDTDNILDEFILRFAHRHHHHHHRGFYGSVCKIYYQIKNMKARRQIACDIQDIKTKVIDIAQRRQSFPEDHLIDWMNTIQLWIVEGFMEAKEFGKTLEEVTEA